jgi:hypothetical protein
MSHRCITNSCMPFFSGKKCSPGPFYSGLGTSCSLVSESRVALLRPRLEATSSDAGRSFGAVLGSQTLIELANSATSLLPATHLVLWPLSSEKTSHTDTLPLDFQDIRIAINTNWHPSDVRCLASARILTLKLPMLIITMHGYRISVSRADLPRNTIRVDLREQRRG